MRGTERISQIQAFALNFIELAIGVLLLIHHPGGEFVLYILTVILSFMIPLRALFFIRSGIRDGSHTDLCLIALNLLLGVILLIFPDLFLKWIAVFYGWRTFAYGLLMTAGACVMVHDRHPGALGSLISGMISVPLGLFLIFSSYFPIKEDVITLIAAVWFLLYGFLGVFYQIQVLLSRTFRTILPRSLSGPILINAFLPLEAYIAVHQKMASSFGQVADTGEDADLHVYIYLKGKGPESFGHLDFSYRGTIYSYGNHDPAARRLFGTMGDGVLICSEVSSFLQESITTDGKTVLDYGIRLTEEQKQILEERIREMMSRCQPWKCSAAEALSKGKDAGSCHDYASRVYKETFCDMYKFTSGRFRTYFIAGASCVSFTDTLIRTPGLDLFDLSNFVIPGTYLAFLNSEYERGDSAVICRTLYAAGVHEALDSHEKAADSVNPQLSGF
ncbi:MAG: hypothetical protein IKD68_09680 [Solobacterium sp.]|nr:hypothetical protein [Solobacterium sp.]